MIDFKKISIEDKNWIDKVLQYSDFRGAEYCFTNLFIWEEAYDSKIARYNEYLLLISGEGNETRYLFPAGRGDLSTVIDAIKEDASERGVPPILIGIDRPTKELLSRQYPEWNFSEVRNSFDYIYESEKLISLTGKKLQSKRNHLKRFEELTGWVYEEIDHSNIDECISYNKRWCRENGCGKEDSLALECNAVKKALHNFFDLKLSGGLLRLNGDVVAYTIGEQINSDTAIVHVEKADSNIRGAYQMINRTFAEKIAKDLKYINREDDAGDMGLRRAKESYHPIFMQEKYAAIIF